MTDIYAPLQKYFGYNEFRPLQKEIISRVLQYKDSFVLMPTGGGKSLCYQLPSIMMNGTTVVVSPLISLMKDQVDALLQNGVKSAFLNSSLSPIQQADIINRFTSQDLSLLYVAPERLVQPSFLQLLQTVDINFFAIDEAHCISQWGHDFRPEYRKLDCIRKKFPDKPIIALTATATPRVCSDIIERLVLQDAHTFQASFNRPNLSYSVIPKQNPYDQLTEYIDTYKGESGIIYCQSRATVNTVTAHLQDLGIKARAYHAGLSDEERRDNQEAFIKEDVDIIVATIAFGMGIDKPNVRFVIHYNLPKTLEHYYQETGRAGRDGLPSTCVLLFNYADRFSYERFIRELENEQEQIVALRQLSQVCEYAQSTSCRRKQLLHYFGEETDVANCQSCDNCTTTRKTFDATVLTQKILSCIYHVRGKFGIGQIVNILVGSKAQKILDYNHHKLSTYGIIKDYSVKDIKTFIYELIHQGYINQSSDQYGLLGLTKKSVEVLQNKEQVFLILPETTTQRTSSDTDTRVINNGLFQTLRSLRKELADEANVPPFVIFSDNSLKDMSAYLPQSKKEFRKIKGVGEKKMEQYADIFLKEIKDYIQKLG